MNRISQTGFSLLELLVAVVVFSIGLLGIAGMQANSMKNNHLSFVKTQAANMATDMADRIRANNTQAISYDDYDSSVEAADPGDACVSAAGCSRANLAVYDRFQWGQQFRRADKPVLPNGRGLIDVAVDGAGVPATVTINILWQEVNLDDVARFECIDGQADDQACFQLSFRL